MSGRRWLISSTLLLSTTVVCIFLRRRKRDTNCRSDYSTSDYEDNYDGSEGGAISDNDLFKLVTKLHEENLFKQPPPPEDCPICLLCLPTLASGLTYYACCGKIICCGCGYAPVKDNMGNIIREKKCPFCRTPAPKSNEEYNERIRKRVELDDANAMRHLGCYYRDEKHGLPQDYAKALELFLRAGELGHSDAYCDVGYAYETGRGVERDKKKAKHYYELAAIGGNIGARFNLGRKEHDAALNFGMARSEYTVSLKKTHTKKALLHYIIAAGGGYAESLTVIKQFYSTGYATKDDYAKALRDYQAYLDSIKSFQRDKAAAAYANYRYY